jgi:hypothetical protein
VELVIRGAGNDVAEAELALGWMNDVLYNPDWRPENVARIRDVVDQGLAGLRNTTARPEETWVNDPANAYRFQHDRLYLATSSFQTRQHGAHRLRWMLREAPAGEADAVDAAIAALATRGAGLDARSCAMHSVQPANSREHCPKRAPCCCAKQRAIWSSR